MAETIGDEGITAASFEAPVFGRRNLTVAAAIFAVALFALFALQHQFGIVSTSVSQYPHFVYQAESFLHGRLDVDLPFKVYDIEIINGKSYIYYPPFPALLLLPFVAIFGLRTSDVLFTAVVSASILPTLYLLFEQVRALGLTRRSWVENAVLSVLLYFGSIILWLSLGGQLWFETHIVAMAATLLSLLLAFRRHFAWSAVLLGGAFFSRFTMALGFPFLFYLAWQDAGADPLLGRFVASLRSRAPDWRAVPWRRLLPPAAVTAGVVLLFFLRNALTFGSPLDDGYHTLLRERYPEILTSGVFNLRYVPSNIAAFFFSMPHVEWIGGRFDRHPALDMLNNQIAISVFATTPLFLLLFWRNRRRSGLRAALWVTIGLIVVSLLPFYTAGAYQFGVRYLTDAYPYAFLLLGLTELRLDWRAVALGLLGIAVNYLGAAQFWTGHIFHF